jgi:hypothetical protein
MGQGTSESFMSRLQRSGVLLAAFLGCIGTAGKPADADSDPG